MADAIDGGTARQRQLLEEILDGMGLRASVQVRLEPYADRDPTAAGAEEEQGVAIRFLEQELLDVRRRWELEMAAVSFRIRSQREGLEPVLLTDVGRGGHSLRWSRGPGGPLAAANVERLRRDLAAAAGPHLERLELLQPFGHAWAVSLRTDEPHSFLRGAFRDFLAAVRPWEERCGRQRYIEVADAEEEPVLESGCTGSSCSGRTRRDVECCAPLGPLSRGLYWRPPRCPVFD